MLGFGEFYFIVNTIVPIASKIAWVVAIVTPTVAMLTYDGRKVSKKKNTKGGK